MVYSWLGVVSWTKHPNKSIHLLSGEVAAFTCWALFQSLWESRWTGCKFPLPDLGMIARTCIFFAFFWVLIDSLARCARFCNFEGFCTLESSITCWMAHIAWLFWASHKRICEHSRNLHVVCLLKDQIYLPMVPPALGLLPCRKCFHQRWRRSFPFHISSVLPVPRKKILSWRPRDTRRSLWVRPFAGKKIQTPQIESFVFVFYEPSLSFLTASCSVGDSFIERSM